MNGINLAVPPQAIDIPEFWNLLFISGEITGETGMEVSHKLMTIEMINKTNQDMQPATIIINSVGGDLSAAWQICDVMDFIETPVHTVGLGQVCSSGLLILMNGELGERKVTDRTSIMSHIYSWGSVGSHNQLMSATTEMKNIHERMIKHYIECTGLDKKTLEEELLNDTDKWLTPANAKKYNLVDEVVTSNKTKRIRKQKKTTKPKRTKNVRK